jgi:hypothetical protein
LDTAGQVTAPRSKNRSGSFANSTAWQSPQPGKVGGLEKSAAISLPLHLPLYLPLQPWQSIFSTDSNFFSPSVSKVYSAARE